jgi:hypothetical protein
MFRFSKRMIAGAVICLFLVLGAGPLAAQGKKLQVIADMAEIHLGPDTASQVVETLERGAIMTLASAIKARASWFFVYFVSPQTGKTRGGYVLEDHVRKLYSDLKIINISAEDEVTQPKELDFSDLLYKPIVAWGMDRNALITAEGQPFNTQKAAGGEIVRYKRSILAKRSLVEYMFEGGRLSATRLTLLENYADKNRYIEDYVKIKDRVIAKIGRPQTDKVIWQDPAFKNNDARWGTAVGMGQLEFRSEWTLPGVDLMITLDGQDSHVSLGAEMSGLKYKTASF